MGSKTKEKGGGLHLIVREAILAPFWEDVEFSFNLEVGLRLEQDVPP